MVLQKDSNPTGHTVLAETPSLQGGVDPGYPSSCQSHTLSPRLTPGLGQEALINE